MWVNREADRESSALLSSDDFAVKLEQWPDLHTVGITRFSTANVVGVDLGSDHQTPLHEWVHLVLVGSRTDTKLYINGVLQTTFPKSIRLPLTWLGSTRGHTEFGAFLLDELAIYNDALTAAQVMEIYRFGANGAPQEVRREGPHGFGAFYFDDSPEARDQGPIRQVTIWSGTCIDAIQVGYESVTLPKHGGAGGSPTTISLEPGDPLVEVSGEYGGQEVTGSGIFRLTLKTRSGITYGPYGTSRGLPFSINAGSDQIGAFFGTSSSYFNSLGAVIVR